MIIKDWILLKEEQKDVYAMNKRRAALRYKKMMDKFGESIRFVCVSGSDIFMQEELIDEVKKINKRARKEQK